MTVIESFYSAFAHKDADAMTALYHDEIEFEDPAFGKLKGERAKAMWHMLLHNSADLHVEFRDVKQSGNHGVAHWEATYTFSSTGRKVVNKIDAQFELKDGKIYRHKDSFSLYTWASQALGVQGWLLGWTGFFKKQLQKQTNSMLDKYIARYRTD